MWFLLNLPGTWPDAVRGSILIGLLTLVDLAAAALAKAGVTRLSARQAGAGASSRHGLSGQFSGGGLMLVAGLALFLLVFLLMASALKDQQVHGMMLGWSMGSVVGGAVIDVALFSARLATKDWVAIAAGVVAMGVLLVPTPSGSTSPEVAAPVRAVIPVQGGRGPANPGWDGILTQPSAGNPSRITRLDGHPAAGRRTGPASRRPQPRHPQPRHVQPRHLQAESLQPRHVQLSSLMSRGLTSAGLMSGVHEQAGPVAARARSARLKPGPRHRPNHTPARARRPVIAAWIARPS